MFVNFLWKSFAALSIVIQSILLLTAVIFPLNQWKCCYCKKNHNFYQHHFRLQASSLVEWQFDGNGGNIAFGKPRHGCLNSSKSMKILQLQNITTLQKFLEIIVISWQKFEGSVGNIAFGSFSGLAHQALAAGAVSIMGERITTMPLWWICLSDLVCGVSLHAIMMYLPKGIAWTHQNRWILRVSPNDLWTLTESPKIHPIWRLSLYGSWSCV